MSAPVLRSTAGRAEAPDASATAQRYGRPEAGWRLALYTLIFEADTRAGRAFDVALIWAILLSIVVVVLDSVAPLAARHGALFNAMEWCFTALFTLEYLARLLCVQRPVRYARSFYGVVDLLAIVPTYLALLVPGLSALIDVRVLRLLRVVRVFKLSRYAAEAELLRLALVASARKITVFVGFVLMVVLVMGTLMYVIEGPAHGYTSIPVSVYWAITTMTTVGFGDITPKTDVGRAITSVMMLLGWGVLAVPTGIVTAELSARRSGALADAEARSRPCDTCGAEGHRHDARYCHRCGARLTARPGA